LTATQAYLAVYKSVKSPSVASVCSTKLLRKASVKSYIDKRMGEIHNEKTADIAEVMEFFTSSMRGQLKDEVLTMEGSIKEVRISSRDRLKAAESLAKAHGLFEKNVNISVDLPIFGGEDELQD
uniref:terminase small subunit n=1 Tax=Ileibacterium valens TaxID=1862668 RepID=UPI00272D79E8